MGHQIPKLTQEVAHAAGNLVHQDSPISHDQLTRLFNGVGLGHADPGSEGFGKAKRMRAVLDHALAHDRAAGARLVARVISSLRGSGGFRADSYAFIGEQPYLNLRDAYRASGFDLGRDGEICRRVIDTGVGIESDEVLRTYARRIQRNSDDAPLLTGTGKDLLEATARRVISDRGGTYPGHDLPGTLFHAFSAAGLSAPSPSAMQSILRELDSDPRARFAQVLYLLGCVLSQLRNKEGTGHGRPFAPSVTDDEAKSAAKAMALISEALLAAKARGEMAATQGP